MIVIYNMIALGWVVLGLAAGVILNLLLFGSINSDRMLFFGGPFIILADMLYRIRVGEGKWFSPNSGGHIFYIPMWIVGILWVVLGFFESPRR